MPLLRLISIGIRNVLTKQHPYFSCCASCGEIARPVKHRLCTSLEHNFPIDAVIWSGGDDPQATRADATWRSMQKQAPWLRTVTILGHNTAGTAKHTPHHACLQTLAPTARPEQAPAYAHTLPGLAPHYVLIKAGTLFTAPLLPHDLFTPNGIPLLFWQQEQNADHTEAMQEITRQYGISFSSAMPAPIEAIVPQRIDIIQTFTGMLAQTGLAVPAAQWLPLAALWAFNAQQTVPQATPAFTLE